MSIKPDHWIRRMALEHGMIEPFVERQVRQGVVSYGVSSFGYDIRVADEFRIFTPATGQLTVVDPKAIDERAMVPYQGETCIIPPNSFALARTVEYFRIPRNILAVCLGKCVTADTRVVDATSGAWLPISVFSESSHTVGLDGWKMQTVPVAEWIPQGKKPVFELRTKAGLRIRATANHPFRQIHGWTPLAQLRAGNRIAIAREIPVFGTTQIPDWEATLLGLMIAEGQCDTPGYSPTFTSSDPVLIDLLRDAVSQGGLGEVTKRGPYGYRLVNHARRGGIPARNRATLWLSGYRLNVTAAHKFVPQAIFRAPRESVRLFLQALFSGDGGLYRSNESFFLEYYSKSRRLVEDVHHLLLRFGVFALLRQKTTSIGTEAHSLQITDREQIVRFAQEIGFCPGSIKQLRLEQTILPLLANAPVRLRSNFDTLPASAWGLLRATVDRAGLSFNHLGVRTQPSQSVPLAAAQKISIATGDLDLMALASGPVWDVVESIEAAGEEEVFDISVPNVHNFVANDIIVHNSTYARCGIVVNVTPFEPEWEGFVTIEISNTTPLPAKIYSNEGIAQVLFFEGDPPEVSYADRKGKYQAQHGITLPRL